MVWRLLLQLRNGVRWLLSQEGSPGQRCRGFAVGVFAGCYPFFGFQTIIAVVLASLVRGNRILAAAATWVSNPFTYAPLFLLNYMVGKWLLGAVGIHSENVSPGGVEVSVGENWLSQGWTYGSRLLLGSTAVGLVLGGLAALLCWLWLRRTQPTP